MAAAAPAVTVTVTVAGRAARRRVPAVDRRHADETTAVEEDRERTASLDVDELLADVVGRGVDVVATGGITTPEEVSRVLALGARAVQVGTAFLLADEAGTNAVHRAALVDPEFTTTGVTRAFSGRYARGLRSSPRGAAVMFLIPSHCSSGSLHSTFADTASLLARPAARTLSKGST